MIGSSVGDGGDGGDGGGSFSELQKILFEMDSWVTVNGCIIRLIFMEFWVEWSWWALVEDTALSFGWVGLQRIDFKLVSLFHL